MDVSFELNNFKSHFSEKIEKEQQELKACKKKTELEIKLAQEMKLNVSMNENLMYNLSCIGCSRFSYCCCSLKMRTDSFFFKH